MSKHKGNDASEKVLVRLRRRRDWRCLHTSSDAAAVDCSAVPTLPTIELAGQRHELPLDEKIEQNVWDVFEHLVPIIHDCLNGSSRRWLGSYWYWWYNRRCKYISIRIDMRNGQCILMDRHGRRISFETLEYQYQPTVKKETLSDT